MCEFVVVRCMRLVVIMLPGRLAWWRVGGVVVALAWWSVPGLGSHGPPTVALRRSVASDSIDESCASRGR